MVHQANLIDPITGAVIDRKNLRARNEASLANAELGGAGLVADPSFDRIESLLIQQKGVEFGAGAARATGVLTAQGRNVAPERGVQRFVIPLPRKRSRTIGAGVGGLQARGFDGVPAFSSIGGI